jgi:hypothetical protein
MVATDWAAALNAMKVDRKAWRNRNGGAVTTYNNVEDAVRRIVDLVDSAGWRAMLDTSRIEVRRPVGVGCTYSDFYRLAEHTWQEYYHHYSD